MPRKKTNKVEAADYTIAIDIGYGYTQAIDSNSNRDIQPSVYCAQPHRLMGDEFEAEQKTYPGLTMYNADGNILTGRMAMAHAESPDMLLRLSARENTEDGNEIRLRMVRMMAARLNPTITDGGTIHARIVTGLPVNYLRDRNSLKLALEGAHRVLTDTADFVLNITQATVMPQPLGAVYSYRLTDDGSIADFNYDRVVVFDFGTLTAQVVSHRRSGTSGGGYIGGQSFSVEAGAHIIRSELYAWLEAEYGVSDMPLERIEESIVTGILRVQGEDRNVTEVINRACARILGIVQRHATANVGSGIDADVVIVSGGIAERMYPHIKAIYGDARTYISDDPQWENVTGYRNFALFKERTKA